VSKAPRVTADDVIRALRRIGFAKISLRFFKRHLLPVSEVLFLMPTIPFTPHCSYSYSYSLLNFEIINSE